MEDYGDTTTAITVSHSGGSVVLYGGQDKWD